jgi:signal transduction histidine kinase
MLHNQKLQSVGQLAAGIAHEINTPIQYIGDNARFLDDAFQELSDLLIACGDVRQAVLERQSSEEAIARLTAAFDRAEVDYLLDETPKAIAQSLEGVERVARIVRSMKEFSHPGGQQKQLADINRAIENTVTITRNEWKHVAEVVTELAPDLPRVPCLVAEINQVLLNLLVNAAYAIAEKPGEKPGRMGVIAIRTRKCGDFVEIRVEDSGIGIPDPIQPRVFDPFFTTRPVGQGTGQGLAIAHSVVARKHGGTIRFQTEVGKGTTFVIRLPLGDAVATSCDTMGLDSPQR